MSAVGHVSYPHRSFDKRDSDTFKLEDLSKAIQAGDLFYLGEGRSGPAARLDLDGGRFVYAIALQSVKIEERGRYVTLVANKTEKGEIEFPPGTHPKEHASIKALAEFLQEVSARAPHPNAAVLLREEDPGVPRPRAPISLSRERLATLETA